MERRMMSAKLDKKALDAIKKQADKENRSFSNMIEVILQEWVKQKAA